MKNLINDFTDGIQMIGFEMYSLIVEKGREKLDARRGIRGDWIGFDGTRLDGYELFATYERKK